MSREILRIHTIPPHCQQEKKCTYRAAFVSGQKRIFLGLSLYTSLQAEFSPRNARSYLESEHPSPPPHPSPLSPQGRPLLPPLSKRPMFVVGVHPTPPPPPPTPTKLFSLRSTSDRLFRGLPPPFFRGRRERKLHPPPPPSPTINPLWTSCRQLHAA